MHVKESTESQLPFPSEVTVGGKLMERGLHQRITTEHTWLPGRTKSFIVSKSIKIMLKSFSCKYIARELICQGADRTTSLQVTGVMVVSQGNLVTFDVHSRSKHLRS